MKRVVSIIMVLALMLTLSVFPASAMTGKSVKDGVVQMGDFESLTKGYIVFYPEELEKTDKEYPVAVWANGTMCAPGLYTLLLQRVAKEGYVVIASPELMSANGKEQRKAIDYIINENSKSDSTFYGKIATDKVAAFGHSQGGRSSVNAAAADDRIGCVISLAGSSYDYEAEKLGTPAFFIAGSNDIIVPAKKWLKPAYEACTGPAVYASLKGAIHTTCTVSTKEYAHYSVLWMNAWLNGDRQALEAFRENGELSKDTKWTGYMSKDLDKYAASVFSEGNLLIVIGGLVIILAVIAAAYMKRKKKA